MIPSNIQPDVSMGHTGSGTDGISYNTDRDGNPNVFNVGRNADGLWLDNNWAKPDNTWNLDNELMFRLRNYFFWCKICNIGKFKQIKKLIFNPCSDGIPRTLGNMRNLGFLRKFLIEIIKRIC